MRGRPSTYNNTDVVEKAQKVFWTKGYTATSLEELLVAMNMGSGSFYNAFKGGKKELFRQAILQRRKAFKAFEKELDQSEHPVELIREFFRSIAKADKQTHMQGCLIANTVVEMASLDKDLEKESVKILKEVEHLYTSAIKKAQKKGSLKNQTDPVILGRYLVTLWNGLNVTRRMYPNKEALSELIEIQLEVIR